MAAWDETWEQKAANFRDHLREGLVNTRVADKLEEVWPAELQTQIALVYTYKATLQMVFTLLGDVRTLTPHLDEMVCKIGMDIARPLGYADVITQTLEQTSPEWRHKTIRYIKFFLDMMESV